MRWMLTGVAPRVLEMPIAAREQGELLIATRAGTVQIAGGSAHQNSGVVRD
jgi:hypothetical protein